MANLADQFSYAHRFYRQITSWLTTKITSNIILIGLIFIHLIITILLAANLNIWIDETYSLDASQLNLAHAIDRANSGYQPPLYYFILTLWRNLNHSIFFARLFSVFCIALTLYIVAKLAQKIFPDIHPAWVVATVAFNPFTIWAAVEIRAYAFILLLSALLLLNFFDGYFCEQPKTISRRWYVIFSIIGLYAHYYIAFLLIANGFVLLVFRRWQTLRWYILEQCLLVGLCFAPMLLVVSGQVQPDGLNPKTVTGNLLIASVRFIYQTFFTWVLPTEDWGLYNLQRILRLIGFITLLALLTKNRKYIQLNQKTSIGIITVFLFICFLSIRNHIGTNVTGLKHLSTAFIPAIFSLFYLLALEPNIKMKKLMVRGTSLLVLVISLISLSIHYKPMAKKGDLIRVANYIMRQEKPGQPILVYNPELAWPFRYYYSGLNSLAVVPNELDLSLFFDVNQFIITDEQVIVDALKPVSANHESLWLIIDTRPYLRVTFPESYEFLEAFLAKNYEVKQTQDFYNSQVRYLQKK